MSTKSPHRVRKEYQKQRDALFKRAKRLGLQLEFPTYKELIDAGYSIEDTDKIAETMKTLRGSKLIEEVETGGAFAKLEYVQLTPTEGFAQTYNKDYTQRRRVLETRSLDFGKNIYTVDRQTGEVFESPVDQFIIRGKFGVEHKISPYFDVVSGRASEQYDPQKRDREILKEIKEAEKEYPTEEIAPIVEPTAPTYTPPATYDLSYDSDSYQLDMEYNYERAETTYNHLTTIIDRLVDDDNLKSKLYELLNNTYRLKTYDSEEAFDWALETDKNLSDIKDVLKYYKTENVDTLMGAISDLIGGDYSSTSGRSLLPEKENKLLPQAFDDIDLDAGADFISDEIHTDEEVPQEQIDEASYRYAEEAYNAAKEVIEKYNNNSWIVIGNKSGFYSNPNQVRERLNKILEESYNEATNDPDDAYSWGQYITSELGHLQNSIEEGNDTYMDDDYLENLDDIAYILNGGQTIDDDMSMMLFDAYTW